ncbi:T-complex protein 1 subunit gamma [Morus notabilis]|uniref:T-complex protein 1 subunit gamma n=1 Tax=Morus notabilis TaxID=981085 RepID=W9QM46_9ROSA|nr:T-complex protein 1 subunit gamma [Morus notabilis]
MGLFIRCDNVGDLAIDATTTVGVDLGQGLSEVDVKEYIKVEKVPGVQLEDSKVLKGVMFNKDVVAPGKMRRKIVNPRIILLDCPLEYKKDQMNCKSLMLFEVKKIEGEFFTFIVDYKDPKACTILLRGASKDLLNEVERNLQDAMSVARNIIKNPKLVPGGGATELTVSATLKQKSSSIEGIEKHANGENAWIGIDGNTGAITDMKERKVWLWFPVYPTKFVVTLYLAKGKDDIVGGIKKKQAPGASAPSKPQIETEADADNEQILRDRSDHKIDKDKTTQRLLHNDVWLGGESFSSDFRVYRNSSLHNSPIISFYTLAAVKNVSWNFLFRKEPSERNERNPGVIGLSRGSENEFRKWSAGWGSLRTRIRTRTLIRRTLIRRTQTMRTRTRRAQIRRTRTRRTRTKSTLIRRTRTRKTQTRRTWIRRTRTSKSRIKRTRTMRTRTRRTRIKRTRTRKIRIRRTRTRTLTRSPSRSPESFPSYQLNMHESHSGF